MRAGGGVFTLKSFHSSSAPPPDLHAFACPNCNGKVDKERTYELRYSQILPFFKGSEGVPTIFLEYYPKITYSDYKLIRKDAQFLERRARVCDSCYIEFTEVERSAFSRPKTLRTSTDNSRGSESPKLTRSLSSSRNSIASDGHSPPLSRSESSASRFSNNSQPNSNSPPISPDFQRSVKPTTPPQKTRISRPTSEYSNNSPHSNSSSPTTSPHSTSSPTFSSSAPTNHYHSKTKNGKYQEAYYLKLYDELDALRKEVQEMRVNGGSDELAKQLKEREEELKVQKKVLESKTRQENTQKDEQIKELQAMISGMQQEHMKALNTIELEYERKLQQKIAIFDREKEELTKRIADLKRENEELSLKSERTIAADRSDMIAEVNNVKHRLETEKVGDVETLKKKYEAQITELRTENGELRKQIEILKEKQRETEKRHK